MIKITVYQDVAEQMVAFLTSAGQQGRMPDWYQTLNYARGLNCSAMEFEARLKEIDPSFEPASFAEWLNRAATAQLAEAEAQLAMSVRQQLSVGVGVRG